MTDSDHSAAPVPQRGTFGHFTKPDHENPGCFTFTSVGRRVPARPAGVEVEAAWDAGGPSRRQAQAEDTRDAEGYYLPRPGELLAGRYRVQGVLGKGVFGVVVSAADTAAAESPEVSPPFFHVAPCGPVAATLRRSFIKTGFSLFAPWRLCLT